MYIQILSMYQLTATLEPVVTAPRCCLQGEAATKAKANQSSGKGEEGLLAGAHNLEYWTQESKKNVGGVS